MLKKEFLILFAFISSGALAQTSNSLNFSLGTVNGKAGEYVYIPETGDTWLYTYTW